MTTGLVNTHIDRSIANIDFSAYRSKIRTYITSIHPLTEALLPRKSVVRLTDCLDMTLDVYRGRMTTTHHQHQHILLVLKYTMRVKSYLDLFLREKMIQMMLLPAS